VEDPATGSANLALGGLLTSLRPEPDLVLQLRIAQGAEMGRRACSRRRPRSAAAGLSRRGSAGAASRS
jgi:predicted PhzF superfamily epimerase YddE/YHI9